MITVEKENTVMLYCGSLSISHTVNKIHYIKTVYMFIQKQFYFGMFTSKNVIKVICNFASTNIASKSALHYGWHLCLELEYGTISVGNGMTMVNAFLSMTHL